MQFFLGEQRRPAKWGEAQAFFDAARASSSLLCIDWPFGLAHGYARMHVPGTAHRRENVAVLMCEAVHGPKPGPEYQAAHDCGRSLCVNPAHLRWATQSENEADKHRHGTTRRGKPPKLTKADVVAIRRRRADGERGKDLAAEYGVSDATISETVHRRRWVDIP